MKKLLLYAGCLGFLTINSALTCGKQCFYLVPIFTEVEPLKNLDNSGAFPVLLETGTTGNREAYGFRLKIHSLKQEPADSLQIDPECLDYNPSPALMELKIITRSGFAPDVAPNADVSDRFRYVVPSSGRYFPVTMVKDYFHRLLITEDSSNIDFLMVRPPQEPAWHTFELQMFFSDTTTRSVFTDSIYLQ